ncbi:hypothetical protein KM043_004677 [Ampulex compressa]|nr:hypothetical protein KM043_004677 [Ampulex compressa]
MRYYRRSGGQKVLSVSAVYTQGATVYSASRIGIRTSRIPERAVFVRKRRNNNGGYQVGRGEGGGDERDGVWNQRPGRPGTAGPLTGRKRGRQKLAAEKPSPIQRRENGCRASNVSVIARAESKTEEKQR